MMSLLFFKTVYYTIYLFLDRRKFNEKNYIIRVFVRTRFDIE